MIPEYNRAPVAMTVVCRTLRMLKRMYPLVPIEERLLEEKRHHTGWAASIPETAVDIA